MTHVKYSISITAMIILALCGCARDIVVENQDAHVSSIGPIELDAQDNVIVHYTLRDPEGDDQNVRVDICTAPDDGCGIAPEALGGDPTTRLPTIPAGTDVPHQFRWAPWCGRWQAEDRVESDPDTEYVVGLTILTSESETVYSEPFTLSALGTTGGDCTE